MTESKNAYSSYEKWKGWTSPFTYNEEDAEYFAAEMQDVHISGADLLEIGFGSGAFLQWATDNGARVSGTELNILMIAEATKKGIAVISSRIEDIADEYSSNFDTIVALDVFEHFTLEDVAKRLAAVERMLRPGGNLVLRFPNSQSPFGLAPQFGDPTHQSSLSGSIVEALILQTTLRKVRYSAAYRVKGTKLQEKIGRIVRYKVQDFVALVLNLIYRSMIPWNPVVVLVLQKTTVTDVTHR